MTSFQPWQPTPAYVDPCAGGCVPWQDCEEKRGKDGVSTYRKCMRKGPDGKPCGKFVSRDPEGCTHPVSNIKEGVSAKGPYRFCGDCKTSFIQAQPQSGGPAKRSYTEVSAFGAPPPREEGMEIVMHRLGRLEAEVVRLAAILDSQKTN